ncbi:DUF2267 domain-containing protein [Haloterrigena salinisoli]|uniref:DUF2267 domain-containing protein n=1 Tax=Haloterrigena salinisoli TaxID=3132747 RepID=UPI0030CD11FB
MDESDFHDRVTRAGEIDDPEPITAATLETLGETLSSGQAEDVAEYLPGEYASTLTDASERAGDDESDTDGEAAESISRAAFVERVRDRAADYAGGGIPDETDELRPRVEAVTEALQETIPREEQRGVRSQLPEDVESLFTGGESGR